ncbi:DUF6882 domain-containing protein [Seonamhaeicola sp.]|uniref:DUF6882 domain-containing protein n=1 Tax=Seonamhaeicola sp. TaxID=1912245 RepID=UPI0026224032|nr:DUF6882 domain-containing protein [Seonamhaeicola sp.]
MMNFFKSLFGKDKATMQWNNHDFIEGAFEGLQLQTDAHKKTWKLGKEKQWNVDMNEGMLWFDFSDGTRVSTDIQIIGTYNSKNGTFLWGWDHPSVRGELAQHANLAYEWGKENEEPGFTEVQLTCSIDDVWKIAGAVNRISGGSGVYKGNSGATQVFMTLGTIEMGK